MGLDQIGSVSETVTPQWLVVKTYGASRLLLLLLSLPLLLLLLLLLLVFVSC